MGGCSHERRETEGQTHEKDKNGRLITIRSYRCLDCDAVFTDRTVRGNTPPLKVSGVETGRFPETEEAQNNFPPPAVEEKTMAKSEEKNGPNKRTESALADSRWESGKTYTKVVTPRKGKNAGKKVTCKMTVLKSGFKDQDGNLWPTPTSLTTNFVVKYCGVSDETRRPASTFFGIDIPKDKKIQTRKPAKAKPPKKAKAPKAAKAATKKAAPKAAPTKSNGEDKSAAPASSPSASNLPPPIDI